MQKNSQKREEMCKQGRNDKIECTELNNTINKKIMKDIRKFNMENMNTYVLYNTEK